MRVFLISTLLLVPVMGAKDNDDKSKMVAKTFEGLAWRGIGPALMAGRIADIAIDPANRSTWYIAVGSGGVWKTTNAGTTFQPIFDDQGSYSIGCLAIDPNRTNVIWVGTGENVGGRHVGYGDGVYRSDDGGKSWRNMGLKQSEHIGTILIDPRDSDTIFVAAQGPLWSADGERGLYKSTDGGASWERKLGSGPYTGVNEVVMDPSNPEILYAATHQRMRNVAALINGGPGTGIHKSTDGGETWTRLKTGLPEADMGKIGLAVSPQHPEVVYATIELAHRKGGFYRSADGGASWEKRNDYISGGTGPHYYQEIFASPHQFNRIYQMDVWMHISEDGGKTFRKLGEPHKHSDNHALAFTDDPNYLLAGCDGGLYESHDLGKTWRFFANLMITQFYKVADDYDSSFYHVSGGTQDNNTRGGPWRTDNISGIRNSDWFITLFGDGHQPAVDPTNPDIVYSEWQQGNLVRHDRKTCEIVYIQPQPEKGEPDERFNWDAPILISPHNPATLFYASRRVWRSDDRGDSWRTISGDLSKQQNRLEKKMMGRTWGIDAVWDLWAMSNYGNVTSLAQSPKDEKLIYAGTDDGLVQVTQDGGETWRAIEVGDLPDIPEFSFVNDIKADLHDVDTVYVVLDNHKAGDFSPMIVKSEDRGKKWRNISGDLPDRHLVWRLVQDHVNPQLLFAGTEFGVFFSLNGGEKWTKLGGGAPNIPFRDLAIQTRENDLVGATFGRSFYILDDYSPLRNLAPDDLDSEALLFDVKDAWWYIPRRPLGNRAIGSQGASFFTAPNPPFGATFTYYLGTGYKTAKKARQERETKLVKSNLDIPLPDWQSLHDQEKEEAPAIILTIRDEAGGVVRQVEGPATPGFHRVSWDLSPPNPMARGPKYDPPRQIRQARWLAAPGTYTVSLSKRIDGATTAFGLEKSFEVKPLPGYESTLEGADPQAVAAFNDKVRRLLGTTTAAMAAIAACEQRLTSLKAALADSSTASDEMHRTLNELTKRVYDLKDELNGDRLKKGIGEPMDPPISKRFMVVATGTRFSTYGPTPTLQRSYDIAVERFEAWRRTFSQITDRDLPALERAMDEAGVGWTPGRPVPAVE